MNSTNNTMEKRKVVITGLGVVAPNGVGVDEFWSNVKNGVSGIKDYSWGKDFGFKSKVLGKINDEQIDSLDKNLINNSRYLSFAFEASRQALDDAGLINITKQVDKNRFGVVISSAIADAASMEINLLKREGIVTNEENIQTSYYSFDFGLAASGVADRYGAEGFALNLSTGCSAGLDALGVAMDEIRNGNVDIVIAGACEVPLCPLSIGSFEALGALSSREIPAAKMASCPFSADRDGFVIAEGCGLLILESYEHAVARNAKIYAELAGYASINNSYHMTDLPGDGVDMAKCIELALNDSGSSIDEVNHIGAHGSSTKQNDISETAAIKRIFGSRAYEIPINSLKSMTGHSLAAANTLEVVALCKEIEEQFLHPTINFSNRDSACDLDYVFNDGRKSSINTAVKLSSGFSGIHSAVVLRTVKV